MSFPPFHLPGGHLKPARSHGAGSRHPVRNWRLEIVGAVKFWKYGSSKQAFPGRPAPDILLYLDAGAGQVVVDSLIIQNKSSFRMTAIIRAI